jgi:hypothetical protein
MSFFISGAFFIPEKEGTYAVVYCQGAGAMAERRAHRFFSFKL